jgi:hypothetical protein
MAYAQDRTYRSPSSHSYNDQGAKFRIIPDREADLTRLHILHMTVDEVRDFRDMLDRYIIYADSDGAAITRARRAQVKKEGG